MRLIRVTDADGNIYTLDIDEETAIGIDFQTYDFKEPGKRKINISNSFTVPATAQNMRAFGFPGNVHTASNRFYEKWYIDYWIDNVQFITNARIRIEEVDLDTKRISLFIFEKADIWEDMRNLLWPDMIPELLLWLRDEKNYPVMFAQTSIHSFNGTFNEFLEYYATTTEGLVLTLTFGNLAQYIQQGESVYSENEIDGTYLFGTIGLYRYAENPLDATDKYYADGGHFHIYAKTLFEFLEYKYGYNFYTAGGSFAGNIWDDLYIKGTHIPIRDIAVCTLNGSDWDFFQRNESYPGFFYPYKDAADKPDKSMFDFVQAFFHHFNIVVDNEDNSTNIKLRRFDDITVNGKVYDWSGLAKRPKFKPYIPGYYQNNYIKFSSVYPGGNEYLNSKTIVCGNTSLDPEGDLFEIDAYVPAFSNILTAPMLDVEESFETFQFFVSVGIRTVFDIKVRCFDRNNVTEHVGYVNLYTPSLISMSGEYATISAALVHPEFYEIEKWLSLADMIKFEPFNLYYFQELNGTFYINKISGFNPEKSKAPTKLEVVKISDAAPDPIYITDYYVDGILDEYTDGIGDKYF